MSLYPKLIVISLIIFFIYFIGTLEQIYKKHSNTNGLSLFQ